MEEVLLLGMKDREGYVGITCHAVPIPEHQFQYPPPFLAPCFSPPPPNLNHRLKPRPESCAYPSDARARWQVHVILERLHFVWVAGMHVDRASDAC